MGVHMVHPDLEGQSYDAQPSQVPHLQENGWQVAPGQTEQGEVWPMEVQRFEGQPQIRLHHPDLEVEIVVAESAVPHHRERGWLIVEDESVAEPEVSEGFARLTVDQLRDEARARGLQVSGTKAELLDRLADTDQQQDLAEEGVE
jgi:hypothetical protein